MLLGSEQAMRPKILQLMMMMMMMAVVVVKST
jgi:hypothetical protein